MAAISSGFLISKELQPQALRTRSKGRPADWLNIVANQKNAAFAVFDHGGQESAGEIDGPLYVCPDDLFECVVPVFGHRVVKESDRRSIDQSKD